MKLALFLILTSFSLTISSVSYAETSAKVFKYKDGSCKFDYTIIEKNGKWKKIKYEKGNPDGCNYLIADIISAKNHKRLSYVNLWQMNFEVSTEAGINIYYSKIFCDALGGYMRPSDSVTCFFE